MASGAYWSTSSQLISYWAHDFTATHYKLISLGMKFLVSTISHEGATTSTKFSQQSSLSGASLKGISLSPSFRSMSLVITLQVYFQYNFLRL